MHMPDEEAVANEINFAAGKVRSYRQTVGLPACGICKLMYVMLCYCISVLLLFTSY